MFTSTDSSKKKFLENTRIEREKRENERIQKQQLEKQLQAAVTIQRWWRSRDQQLFWTWWDARLSTQELDLMDFYQLLGIYCIKTKHTPDQTRLKRIVKHLTTNKFSNKVPYYVLLIDMRYMTQARRYLEYVIMQCITQCTSLTDQTSFGPELTLLLQYLNPKTYQTKHMLDPSYVIDIPDKVLQSIAQSILKTTICQCQFLQPFMACVQQIIKLQDRKTQDTAKINALKLWLTTMTRLTLYPIEHAELSSDALDMETASRFLWTNTLAVPYITASIHDMMVDRLRKWALVTPYFLAQEDYAQLGGNGCLFLLANLVDLWNHPNNNLKTEQEMRLVEIVISFLVHISPCFLDYQRPPFTQYHPIFKWSQCSWGNNLPSSVFDKVIKQIEYIWSRAFMDGVFSNIIRFDTSQHPVEQKRRLSFNNTHTKRKSMHNSSFALFSMEIESIFSMYMQLTHLFKAHRKVIFYRIAFTTHLMPQLWKLMNRFGPEGNMVIYLDAAKRNDIDQEPLVQVLKVFCEACSIVFLTLDDVDIFVHKKPFSPQDLIDISSFLNSFYFSLIQQHTSVPTELPPAAESFKSARRLLLQIYDLDLHHPFCPKNHWLLISSMTTGMKSFFNSLFHSLNSDSPTSKRVSNSSASLFLSNLRQGDPVPLRILQLMPHTVSFDMRLKIFRDWVALDRSMTPKSVSRYINIRRDHVLEDGFSALSELPLSAWKGTIRVTFVNELGVEEIGIDQGGPFKDFLTMMISEAFEPNVGLFAATKQNSFYPSATSSIHGKNHIQLFEFIGKVIGKALYEGILLDVQFTRFLLARLLGRNVFLEELKELDEEVWKNLTFIKRYEGDVEDLCLSFETNEQVLGKIESHELKFNGRNTPVTNNNKIEYIYLMADYKLNQRAKEQTKAFIHGFRTVISESWIRIFSPPELQR
ncbi:uncharacterized protein B0P05DRAFT_288472 [Gilbertella persicaria]|nr:uncharacterized protein B0P05DRAFT_288472 [Gilbertella persicaria]KAI8055570.1 hypothetical protein B0P05DRAFT_288472 [Gilbertella persicaria]